MKKGEQADCWAFLALTLLSAYGCNKIYYSQFMPSPGQMRKGETYYVKNDPQCPNAVRVVKACHCGGDGSNHVPPKQLPDYCMPCPQGESCQ